MPTIIDALVVTLGLDSRDYARGSREARDDIRRTRTEADSAAKQMEAAGKRAAGYFRSMRNEVAGLFLAFTAASSITDFTRQILAGDAATGRLAANLGVATSQLSAWEGAVKRVGGTTGDADSAFQMLATAFQNYQLTGDSGHDADFKGLGISLKDLSDPATALLRMADAADRLGRPELVARLQRLGLSQATITLLAKGRGELTGILEEQRKLGVVTEQDAVAAQKWDDALARLDAKIRATVRPAVTALVEQFSRFLDNGRAMETVGPIVAGALAVMATAAVAAAGPWAALAAAIGLAIIAWQDFKRLSNMSEEERAQFDKRGGELRAQAWGQLKNGDIGGFLGTVGEGFSERAFGGGGGAAAGGVASAGNRPFVERLMAAGFSKEQARGITAGILAESGGNAQARNPTSGAMGLGQWLGPRKKKLISRYGPNPTADQQMEFLIWELQGGDPGGPSVGRESTADGALGAYINNFMRPAKGAETWGDISRGRAYLSGQAPRAGLTSGGGAPAGAQTTSVGQITIYTAATDAEGIANDMRGALAKRGLVVQANSGVTP